MHLGLMGFNLIKNQYNMYKGPIFIFFVRKHQKNNPNIFIGIVHIM